jgi:hypothetical protein
MEECPRAHGVCSDGIQNVLGTLLLPVVMFRLAMEGTGNLNQRPES